MMQNGLLEVVLERLGQASATEALFGAGEVAEWPDGVLNALAKAGLLRRTQPAQVIECMGCEENCIMPVHVLSAEGKRPARAFIACDKRDDVGRVPVDMRRMEQWQTTLGLLAKMLAQLFGLSQSDPKAVDVKQWHIGVLKGKKHKSLVVLQAEGHLKLSLAGHVVPLMDVLAFKKNILKLDKAALVRLVDKPEGFTELPKARQARLKARVNEERLKGTKAFLRVVAGEEGISMSRLKQLVSAKTEPPGSYSSLYPSAKKSNTKY